MYIDKLAKAAGTSINTFDDLIQALQNRVNVFHQMGCRASDHGLETLYYHPESEKRAPSILSRSWEKSIGCRRSYDLQERSPH
jgi:glucuronate isomerase